MGGRRAGDGDAGANSPRVVIPRAGLDAARIRGLVAEVARQQGTTADGVLEVLML